MSPKQQRKQVGAPAQMCSTDAVWIHMMRVTPCAAFCACLQSAKLPNLPPHATYVRHPNECYDWGSYGWLLLQSGFVDIVKYRYFFFVNSSVRGPFLPAYARVSFCSATGLSRVCCAGLQHTCAADVIGAGHARPGCTAASVCCRLLLFTIMCTAACQHF